MGGYGLRLYYKTLFCVGLACTGAYTTYGYWKRLKRRSTETIDKEICKEKINKSCKKVLLMGSRGAGKTSLLNQIYIANQYDRHGIVRQKSNAGLFTVLEDDSYRYLLYELPDVHGVIPTWPYYCLFIHHELITLVIDSTDLNNLCIAAMSLKELLADPRIDQTHVLIVANKQDHHNALKTDLIKQILNLPSILVRRYKIEVIGCQTKPLPQKACEPQYHSSIIAVKNKIFSLAA